jgi:hypothetical protein
MPHPSKLSKIASSMVFVMAAASLPGVANSMSLRELQALEKSGAQGENYVRYYLVGVMEGLLEAHMQDVRNGAKSVICLKGRRLEPYMAQNLFDAERQRNAGVYEADMPVQLVLANALQHTFPC